MSLSYTTLQTQIAAYLKRDDLSAYIPSFITMGENEINRRLKVVQAEEIVSFPLLVSTNTVATSVLSASYRAMLKMWKIVNNEFEEIPYLDPLQMLPRRAMAATPLQPNYYTVQGGATIYFDATADLGYTLYALIRKNWALSADVTNWISTSHEDLYLYASLCAAEPFIKNDKRIATWRQLFELVLEQIEDADKDFRGAQNAVLIPDVAGYVGLQRPFNIHAG